MQIVIMCFCRIWLTSSSYAKLVVQLLREKNMILVEKEDKSACAQELFPIKNSWSIFERLIYESNTNN